MSTIDERAVEVGQFSQPGLSQPQVELAGYFEPTQITDLNRHGRLLVVADGVGGAASGEVASRYAIQKILHDFYHARELDLEKRLLTVIRQTNQAIFERNRRFAERRPTATTLMAALVHQNKLFVANVGDARAYVVWDQDIERLSSEHHPQEQVPEPSPPAPALEPAKPGAANPLSSPGLAGLEPISSSKMEEATLPTQTTVSTASVTAVEETVQEPPPGPQPSSTNGPQAEMANASPPLAQVELPLQTVTDPTRKIQTVPLENSVTRPSTPPANFLPLGALGLTDPVEIECFSRRLFPGDTVVLCSGGLTGYISEAEIAQTVTQHPPAMASRRLAELASKRGSRDALSICITKVLSKSVTQAAPARLALPLAPDWEALTKPITRPLPPLPAPPERKLNDTPRRWPMYAAAVVVVLLIGLIGYGVSGFWLSPGSNSGETGVLSQRQAETAVAAQNGAALTGELPAGSDQTGVGSATSPSQPAAPVTSTLVVQNNSPVPTPTGTASRPQTGDVITPTLPTPRPTPVPTIAVPAGCANKGRFAGDITVKDGTEFAPGETFEKAWSVSNYGTCPWGGGYTVRFKEGDSMGAAENIPLLIRVEPEATGVISVPMLTPDVPGTYRGNWQLFDLTGQPFGPDLYVEIKVVPGVAPLNNSQLTTLYDFVLNATQAQWSAEDVTYTITNAPIDRNLVIPAPQGIVVIGATELRGDTPSPDNVLMTHPHQELGMIEGTYVVDTPLQPTDLLVGSLGLPKAAAVNDDGVTFEVTFKPNGGIDQLLFSKLVKYEESPVPIRQALTNVPPRQTGTFVLRVKSGDSISYDWATWIELRLVRP
jgi:serine/threonine protein phosphatase PrpC